MTPILSVRNLSTGSGKKQVLFNVSLDVLPGEILLITGGNGSGKPSPTERSPTTRHTLFSRGKPEGSGRQSTLLKAIYGLLPAWNAAEWGVSEEESLKKGMEAKSNKLVKTGAEVYAKA